MLRKIAITVVAGTSALAMLSALPVAAHDTAIPASELESHASTGSYNAESLPRLPAVAQSELEPGGRSDSAVAIGGLPDRIGGGEVSVFVAGRAYSESFGAWAQGARDD